MHIALVAPGIREIPPQGWDAVAILIWDYSQELLRLGHSVDIINQLRLEPEEQYNPFTSYSAGLIEKINSKNYDFVHLHYDVLCHIIPYLRCPKVGITSHYPYIDQLERHDNHYQSIFNFINNNENHIIFALSQKDRSAFIQNGAKPQHIIMSYNGSNHRNIQPVIEKKYPQKSICIGKIEARKRQYLFENVPNVDFYGPCDNELRSASWFQERWQGEEPSHKALMGIMANYGSMVLLSDGENGTPLVVKEALMAGLPLVLSQFCIDDIDAELPFIDVIKEEQIRDSAYVHQVLKDSRSKQSAWQEIRNYGVQNFSWEHLVKKYEENIEGIIPNRRGLLSIESSSYKKKAKKERQSPSSYKAYLRAAARFFKQKFRRMRK